MSHSRATLFEVLGDLLGAPEELLLDAPFMKSVGFFPRKPTPKVTIVATNGFASVLLHQAEKEAIRQELTLVADDSLDRSDVASLLASICSEVSKRKHSIERGEVFGPAGPLFPNSPLSALFATQPVFLPSTFTQHETPGGVTIGVWLVAISDGEAANARKVGPERFEEYLEGINDLYGFFRQPGNPS